MLIKQFQDKKLSLLGFGTMRLPLISSEKNAPIDEEAVNKMVRYGYDHGVNYFDTAYPYHDGESERVIGRALKQLPRESVYLATKYPGHQIASSYDPQEIFEKQLEKCGVDYFDFYLLHNVNEKSIDTYLNPRWGIVDYFIEQKINGRIRHLGFSSHGEPENLKKFLDVYGDVMEFCQIQLNYMDWTLQDAKTKCEILTARNIPIWVMEPVRGGKLAHLSEEYEDALKKLRPNESIASWAFRWLLTLPNVNMILSGMSNMDQMIDNIKTFTEQLPLSESEVDVLYQIADSMKNSLPCTSCRYCVEVCPQGLDIPMLINMYNQLRFAPQMNIRVRIDALDEDKRPSACIACGACMTMCPQNIDIPTAMQEFAEELSKLPSWEEICRQREAAAKKVV